MSSIFDGHVPIKTCTRCGYEGLSSDFAQGFQCKPCRKLYMAEYRRKNAERLKAYRKTRAAEDYRLHLEWIRANPERHREHVRRSQAKHIERVKRWRHRYHILKYGITPEEYGERFMAQGGVCGICGSPPPDDERFGIDHDHATGTVRGLLCGACNAGIAMFKDDPERLHAAITYLERSRV